MGRSRLNSIVFVVSLPFVAMLALIEDYS